MGSSLIKKRRYQIQEEPNEIDDHLLDIIGNTFKFDHVKGFGEWIKNSVDAYRREVISDENQQIVMRFNDQSAKGSSFECVDFVGMTKNNIEKAFKRWGDPEAAKRGRNVRVYGGHGNGGKFYMREMFEESYFVTYRDGKLNIFGFSESKKYGFAEGYKDLSVSPLEALKIAEIDKLHIQKGILQNIISGKTGFTVVKGIGPREMKNMIRCRLICERLKNHPQVRRLLKNIPVSVIYNNELLYSELKPDPLNPLPGFEHIDPVKIPAVLDLIASAGEPIKITLANNRYPQGELKLYTTEVAMERGNRFEDLNRIDVIGELGVIASYKIQELPTAGYLPQLVFIYGECECPLLEDPDSDCVQNDRAKLVDNEMSKALTEWIGKEVNKLAQRINEVEKKEQESTQKQLSSLYNNFLDIWKNKLMSRVLSTILVGPGDGQGGGNGTGGSLGPIGAGKGNGQKNGGGTGENPGGGDREKKGNRFPRILLSGQDPDPLSTSGETLYLNPRQGVVYQRLQDVVEGIYWINTSAPLAVEILNRYGANHPRWRDYLLQRYVDIFTQEALEKLEKKDPDSFTFGAVSQKIRDVTFLAQEAASKDLREFLFDDHFTPLQ